MTRNAKLLGLFKGQPIHFSWTVNQKFEDGKLWIGGRAGPKCDISNLAHEMAHFVEIDDDRCAITGWGLRVPEQWVYDRWCFEPLTNQCTQRECRVAAYQHNLLKWAGVTRTPKYLVKSFYFLPDHWNVPGEYHPWNKYRLQWCENLVQSLIVKPEYGFDAFEAEWRRKNQVLAGLTQCAA